MSTDLLPSIEIETAPDPDAVAIWLHGLGDDGSGWSEIAGQRFEWEEKDIFALPSWALLRHGANEEAVLFSFDDLPAMRALGLYREAGS